MIRLWEQNLLIPFYGTKRLDIKKLKSLKFVLCSRKEEFAARQKQIRMKEEEGRIDKLVS